MSMDQILVFRVTTLQENMKFATKILIRI